MESDAFYSTDYFWNPLFLLGIPVKFPFFYLILND